MKVDVVVNFYRKFKEWPLVVWGLQRNKDYINHVIVVNDEPWTDATKDALTIVADGLPLVLLDHEHHGFGGHRCINQGMHEVQTDYWCAIDADTFMVPRALEQLCEGASPQVIIYPPVHDIALDTTVDELDKPVIIREGGYAMRTAHREPWSVYRDLLTFEHTESSLALGGRSEFTGYGYIDYDYGCRWALKYGLHNTRTYAPLAYTFPSIARKAPSVDNRHAFMPVLVAYVTKYHPYISVEE